MEETSSCNFSCTLEQMVTKKSSNHIAGDLEFFTAVGQVEIPVGKEHREHTGVHLFLLFLQALNVAAALLEEVPLWSLVKSECVSDMLDALRVAVECFVQIDNPVAHCLELLTLAACYAITASAAALLGYLDRLHDVQAFEAEVGHALGRDWGNPQSCFARLQQLLTSMPTAVGELLELAHYR